MRFVFGLVLISVLATSTILTDHVLNLQPATKPIDRIHSSATETLQTGDSPLLTRLTVLLHQANSKFPGKPTGGSDGGYSGDDTCQWANDGECDDPGIGTGACPQFTDYSDCRRIATNVEDDSCQWANDGECDEPQFGTSACTQGTDRSDCGDVSALRFQNDSCETAFDGVCNDLENGDGTCESRSDRADCIGRERPMQISDHFFGHDDRVILDTNTMPWQVVGQVIDPNGGACTATLVAEDVIITAAHCIEYETGVDPAGEFVTAYAREGGPLRAQVTDYYLAPDRAADRENDEEPAGTDWALLRLDQPLGRELGYLQSRGLMEGGRRAALQRELYQAGYSWDTGDHLSGNLGCELLDIEDDTTMVHNCDTTMGDSGSPFMVREGDEYFVVGTDSTYRIDPNVAAMNIATRSDGWLGYLPQFVAGELSNQQAGDGKPDGKPTKSAH